MRLMVGISTHGGYARYLPKAIESALAFADIVKVYDNGGECSDIVPKGVQYVALDRTSYCIKARRWAIADAITLRADWLLHLDADDWMLRRPTLEGDMCFSDMYLCDDAGTIDGYWKCDFFPRDREGAMAFLRERRTNPMPGKSCYRVGFLKEHNLSWYEWPNTTFGEDVRTIIEYLKHDPKVVYTPEEGYYVYRFHADQDTKSSARRAEFLADLDAYLKGD